MRWVGRLKPTLRQVHVAGERMFVDFAGQTMEVFDGTTGEARRAEIFVAVLGASSYTYAEAVWSQSLPEWISAHVNALAFFDGVPLQITWHGFFTAVGTLALRGAPSVWLAASAGRAVGQNCALDDPPRSSAAS